MSGSRFGKLFSVTTWGESHGAGLGAVVDGCPAGLALSERDIQIDLDRRKPGHTAFSTPRREADEARILSGVFEGRTTGAPIAIIIENLNQRSQDYDDIKNIYRPGHADYTYDQKYGFRDYRGGGRSSGRETCARVAAGAVAKTVLRELGVCIHAYAVSIGSVHIDRANFSLAEAASNPLCMPDRAAFEAAAALVKCAVEDGDSLGGVVECVVSHMPSGVGEPVFDKLQAVLAHAIFSIGAVKGVEFGSGFAAAGKRGSENNDALFNDHGRVAKRTNHAGGILGGISDGADIIFRAAFKPTPSISKSQETVTTTGENTRIQIRGRHDPLIIRRAVVVVEAMTALAVCDLVLQSLSSRMDKLV